MKKLTSVFHIVSSFLLALMVGCSSGQSDHEATLLFESGSYPQAVKDGDYYYCIMPDKRPGHISIYSSQSPDSLGKSAPVSVWEVPNANFQNIWSPELHRINGNWYIYFEADDGNTDNHHIYVLENISGDPLSRHWTLHGPILVNDEWNYGIHPSSFVVDGRQFLIWSGWEKRRTETETQCIFIAEMENPWTLKSERVLISRPEFEWERQWINPDGSRSAYPIFVNENPEPFISPDKKNVIINYSASGIWTVFSTLGMLYASTSDDLLNPDSWKKCNEPVFLASGDSDYRASSNVSIIPGLADDETLMLFQAKLKPDSQIADDQILIKKIDWKNSLPVYGSY